MIGNACDDLQFKLKFGLKDEPQIQIYYLGG